jgi:hypothetical protein
MVGLGDATMAASPLLKVAAERLYALWLDRGDPWADEDERARLSKVLEIFRSCIKSGPRDGPPEFLLVDRDASPMNGATPPTTGWGHTYWTPMSQNVQDLQKHLLDDDDGWVDYEDVDISTAKSLLCQLDNTPPGTLRQVVAELHWWLMVKLPKLLFRNREGWQEEIRNRIKYLSRLRDPELKLDPAQRQGWFSCSSPRTDPMSRKHLLVFVFQNMEEHLKTSIKRKEE